MRWYMPSWCGDFRLDSSLDAKSCKLTAVKLTEHEKKLISDFLEKARKKKWTEATDPLIAENEGILLSAPIAEAGPVLAKGVRPSKASITAVKFADGKLEVFEGTDDRTLTQIEKTVKEKEPAAAASVKRPTPSCPQCQPGAIKPATEALLAFLDEKQHRSWAKLRAIEVTGHLSGHRYVLAHRHSPIAQRVGRVCFDLTDSGVVHFHDVTVPPEEEVLAAKLILENREPWLRNEATCLGFTTRGRAFTDVFQNPFGDEMDGVADAVFTKAVGSAFMGIHDALEDLA